jgi:Flp pilus assembly protein TadD
MTARPQGDSVARLVADAVADAEDALAAGDLAEAGELARDALAAAPGHARALAVLGRVALGALDPEDAEALLSGALDGGPGLAGAWLALADAQIAGRRLGDAFVALERAVALEPLSLEAWRRLGAVAARVRYRHRAVAAYRCAAGLDAADVDLRCDLATALGVAGALDEAERLFRAVIAEAPRHGRAHANLGSALAAGGRLDAAAAAFGRAVQVAPDFVDARANLARCLAEQGRAEEALTEYGRARRLAPEATALVFAEGRVRLDLGRPSEALALAAAGLARRPGDAGLLALRLLALRALGRHDEADALAGLDRFVRVVPLPPPPGLAPSAEALAAALAAHVKAHPSLTWAPPEHATVAGSHTGCLQVPPLGPVAAFEAALSQVVSDYVAALPVDDPHPFVAHRPTEVYFDVWGVVTTGAGHQIPHIHPSAWLSAAYYAELPDLGPPDDPRGWLQLGGPERPLPGGVPFPTRSIRPRVGCVVLLPSYLHHHTLPTGAADTRVSLAADVLAAA